MYCSAKLLAGDSVMGKPLTLNATEKIFFNTSASGAKTVHFSGASDFIASRGKYIRIAYFVV
jgi:hypothetical protein